MAQQLNYETLCNGTTGSRNNDDFCHLWRQGNYQGMRNALSISIRTARAAENRNRYYFDRRQGHTRGLFIQLRRPWMDRENARGRADWQVWTRWQDTSADPPDADTFANNITETIFLIDTNTGTFALLSLAYRGGVDYGWRFAGIASDAGVICAYNPDEDAETPALTAEQTKAYVEDALDSLEAGSLLCPTVANAQPSSGATIELEDAARRMHEALRSFDKLP